MGGARSDNFEERINAIECALEMSFEGLKDEFVRAVVEASKNSEEVRSLLTSWEEKPNKRENIEETLTQIIK